MQNTNNHIELYEEEIHNASVHELCQIIKSINEAAQRARNPANQELLNTLSLRIHEELRLREIEASIRVGV